MKVIFFAVQWSWGLLQTLLGLVVFLIHIKKKHYAYHGAIITEWESRSSVSLGYFVFITREPFFSNSSSSASPKELASRLLVHEYGHTIQSLILGPLYLIVMGVPSALWGILPCAAKKRKAKNLSYFSFFTEKWANHLGEMVTKEKSME